MTPPSLRAIGFTEENEPGPDVPAMDPSLVARVIAVHRESFTVFNGEREAPAEATGRLLFGAGSPEDLPTVGDFVSVRFLDDGAFAVIEAVLPRRSLLKRKTAGKRVDFQLIAANIDTAFIVQALDRNFNINRLQRYLVMVSEDGITPAVLLCKADLLSGDEVSERIEQVHAAAAEIDAIAISNKKTGGLGPLNAMLSPGRTYCLLGSSGVGKTTLLNNLLGNTALATGAVREKDGKGRHTTTRRELVFLPNGSMFIDTPGMRELGLFGVDRGIDRTFDPVARLAEQCRFNDCTHTTESGCAVLEAVNTGQITESEFQNYMKIKRESAFLAMSLQERRKKDKAFGRMCKAIMKGKHKK